VRITTRDGLPAFVAEVSGVAVYLDNDSLIQLAKGSPVLRARFLEALREGGTFLFSATNAVEVAGPQGKSAQAVRAILDAIGANWVPLEMDPRTVMEREQGGSPSAAVAGHFIEAYFKQRAHELAPAGDRIVDLSADRFFKLGEVVEWASRRRDRMRAQALELDETLKNIILESRQRYEREPASLDRAFPPGPFTRRAPATFVWTHLLRALVLEAKAYQFKRNDGLDFCHAVLAAAYGSIAALDKQWKRRIEGLPKPNELALVFYRPEVEELVLALETGASKARASGHSAT